MKYIKVLILVVVLVLGMSLAINTVSSVHLNIKNDLSDTNTTGQAYEITSYASDGLLHVSISPYNTAYTSVNAEVTVMQSGSLLYDNSFKGTTSFTLPLDKGSATLSIIVDGSTVQNYTLSLSNTAVTSTISTPTLIELGATVFLLSVGYNEYRFRVIVKKYSKEDKPKGSYSEELGEEVSNVTDISKKSVVDKESYDEIMNFAKLAEEKYGINIDLDKNSKGDDDNDK